MIKPATDYTVVLENRPGSLARLGETLGTDGVNIEAICGFINEGRGVVHIVVSDPELAKKALEAANIPLASERDVLVVDLRDEPGEMGRITRSLAEHRINVELVYLATNTRLVIGADDIAAAQTVLSS